MASHGTPLLILDGGLGTTLEDHHGVAFSSSTTPLWSSHLLLSDAGQQTLRTCQSAFARSGADVLLTATYQASAEAFARSRSAGWPDGVPQSEIPGLLAAAVQIAEEAARSGGEEGPRRAVRVALGLGPYGACMVPSQEYGGEYDAEHIGEETLLRWHGERLELFETVPEIGERVAYVAFETLPRRDEIVAVRGAFARSGLRGRRFWISCVYPGEAEALPDGTGVGKAVEAMLSCDVAGAVPWGIGINCTKIGKLASLVEAYERAVAGLVGDGRVSGFPALVLYPDGTNGEVYDTITQEWVRPGYGEAAKETPWEKQLGEIVRRAQGREVWAAIMVGGCCKTTPDDIGNLAAELGR